MTGVAAPDRSDPPTGRVAPDWELRFRKWDGTPSKTIPLVACGRDRYGRWFRWPAGTVMTRRSGPPVVPRDDQIVLVPDGGCWVARWSLDGSHELYCDVTTRPVVDGSVVHAVDLDLDVVRWRSGRVALVDQEEFAQRRISLGYPDDVVDAALATAGWLFEAVRSRVEPFAVDGTGRLEPLSSAARARLLTRLGAREDAAATDLIGRWVDEAAESYRRAAVRTFLPILIERAVRSRLLTG